LRDRVFLELPTTVFQTVAFVEFGPKIDDFTITDPRTMGTLAKKHGNLGARRWRALCVVAALQSVVALVTEGAYDRTELMPPVSLKLPASLRGSPRRSFQWPAAGKR
jgi:hypothetical protein